jgi:adenine phosphoribosyltransferase
MDDLIATGGTAIAAGNLVNRFDANIYEYTFLIDLPDLGGSKKLINKNYSVYSLMKFSGE